MNQKYSLVTGFLIALIVFSGAISVTHAQNTNTVQETVTKQSETRDLSVSEMRTLLISLSEQLNKMMDRLRNQMTAKENVRDAALEVGEGEDDQTVESKTLSSSEDDGITDQLVNHFSDTWKSHKFTATLTKESNNVLRYKINGTLPNSCWRAQVYYQENSNTLGVWTYAPTVKDTACTSANSDFHKTGTIEIKNDVSIDELKFFVEEYMTDTVLEVGEGEDDQTVESKTLHSKRNN